LILKRYLRACDVTAEITLPNSQLTASLLVPTLLAHMHTALPSSHLPTQQNLLSISSIRTEPLLKAAAEVADTNIDVTSPQQLFCLLLLFAKNLSSNVIRQQQLTCKT
jgi:hypothetical protein